MQLPALPGVGRDTNATGVKRPGEASPQAPTGFSICQRGFRRGACSTDPAELVLESMEGWGLKAFAFLDVGTDLECAANNAATKRSARENQTPPTSSNIFSISGTFRMPEGTCAFLSNGSAAVNPHAKPEFKPRSVFALFGTNCTPVYFILTLHLDLLEADKKQRTKT